MKVERIVSPEGLYPRPHPEKIEREDGDISIDAVVFERDSKGKEQQQRKKEEGSEPGKEDSPQGEPALLGAPLNVVA